MVYKSGLIFLPFCHNPRVWRTDRRTDGRTDRILTARPRLHSMQRGKNWQREWFVLHDTYHLNVADSVKENKEKLFNLCNAVGKFCFILYCDILISLCMLQWLTLTLWTPQWKIRVLYGHMRSHHLLLHLQPRQIIARTSAQRIFRGNLLLMHALITFCPNWFSGIWLDNKCCNFCYQPCWLYWCITVSGFCTLALPRRLCLPGICLPVCRLLAT